MLSISTLMLLGQVVCSPGQPCQVNITCPQPPACPACPTVSCPQPVCPTPNCVACSTTPPAPRPDAGTPRPDAGTPRPDAGVVVDAGSPRLDAGTPPTPTTLPLRVQGTKIVRSDGTDPRLRGANVFTTRSCDACAYIQPNVAEMNRRVDLVTRWGANFLRLLVEDGAKGTKTSWDVPSRDPAYLQAIVDQVKHIGTKPGVYVMVAYWQSSTFEQNEIPTADTCNEWRVLTKALGGLGPHVLFAITNEPRNTADDYVKGALDACRKAIREEEVANGYPKHIIAVQMPRQWARYMGSWNETTWAHDDQVAIETHFYDPIDGATTQGGQQTTWWKFQILDWVNRVPLIIGEFGPALGMNLADSNELMKRASDLGIPWLGWSMGPRCPPDMLRDNSGGGCGVGMNLQTTQWGDALKAGLSR